MSSQTRQLRSVIVVALLAAIAGCGAGNPLARQRVSGKVTLDSKPLQQGSIQFVPQQSGGIFSGAVILAGEYAMPAQKGLPPGKYLVRISSPEAPRSEGEPSGPPGPGGLPGKERIPAPYNVESTIVIEVTASAPNQFDFDVKTK